MRILEITLILFAFIYLLQLIMKRSLIPTKRMMIILSVLLVLHILVDLMRWQMIPVYLIVLFSLIGEYLNKTLRRGWVRTLVFSLGIVGVMLSALLCSILPIFKLPPTSGAHSLGTEILKLNFGQSEREAKIWYPITHQENKLARYHPHPARSLKGIMGMPGFVLSHLKLVKSNAYQVTQLRQDTTTYPLVIYSHGVMSTLIDNTALLEDIASHGYVVIAIEHDFSFEQYGIDAEAASVIQVGAQTKLIDDLVKYVAPNQTSDYTALLANILPLINQFGIDTSQVALIGHSLGGTTAFNGLATIPQAKTAINIDGPVDTIMMQSLDKPLLYISSFSPELPNAELLKRGVQPAFYRGIKQYELNAVKTLFTNNNTNRSWVRFKQAGHLDLTDVPYIIPILGSKRYSKQTNHLLKSDIIIDFLNQYTKAKSTNKRQDHLAIEWLN